MLETKCQFDWETRSVTMVIPTCPTTTHYTHCTRNPRQETSTSRVLASSSRPHRLTTDPTNSTHALYTTNPQKTKNKSAGKKQIAKWRWVPKKHNTRGKVTKQLHENLSTPHYRWVPKVLLETQGFYEGNRLVWIPKDRPRPQSLPHSIAQPIVKSNRCIWVRKDQSQLIPSAPQVFKPVAPEDTGKVLILRPPQPLEPTTTTPIHSDSACMDKENKDDDNQVLVFPPPRQRVLADTDPLKLKEIDALKIAPSSSISPRIQLSQAAEIFKRHIQPPQWWVNRFSRPQSPRTTIPEASIARSPEQTIQVFFAEAEPEEDLLEAFQHWIPYAEERAEYERLFLQRFWPELPREIRNKVRVLVCKAHYRRHYPFGIINAPFTYQRAMMDVHAALPT